MDTKKQLWQVAVGQLGLVTRKDLDEAGITQAVRRRMVDRGEVVPLGHQTFRAAAAPPSPSQNILAACLEVGGVASHRTAAWLHGIDGFAPGRPPEVVVVRPGSDYRVPLATVHTTTWLPSDDLVVVDGIACLGVARTLFSLASLVPHELSFDVVKGAVDDAARDRKASDRWLWWRLEQLRCRGRNGVSVFEDVLTRRAGGEVTESWLERETLRILREAGLPLPVCQRRIGRRGAFVARVDFLYAPKTVIEVSGHRFHASRSQLERDARRRRELTLAGYDVHEFTYDEIVRHPERLVATACRILGIPLPLLV